MVAAALASAGVQKDAFGFAEYSTVTQPPKPASSKQVLLGAIGSHIENSSEWGKGAISRSNFAQHAFLRPERRRAHWQAVSAPAWNRSSRACQIRDSPLRSSLCCGGETAIDAGARRGIGCRWVRGAHAKMP